MKRSQQHGKHKGKASSPATPPPPPRPPRRPKPSLLTSRAPVVLAGVVVAGLLLWAKRQQQTTTSTQHMQKVHKIMLDGVRQCAAMTPDDPHAADLQWDGNALEVLAYITPWNPKGYTVAEQFAHRLTYVAPVWYQLRQQPQEGAPVELTGGHDADTGWMARVRAAGPGARIVPRVLWEIQNFVLPQQVADVVQLLTKELKDKGYDGYTLEFPMAFGGFAQLLAALKANGVGTVIVAIPAFQMPSRPNTHQEVHVTPGLLQKLSPHVDRFSVMTYDFGRTPTGVPNSPVEWMKDSIVLLTGGDTAIQTQLLLGLPWYGYANGQPLVGHEFQSRVLDRPEQLQQVQWDEQSAEHVFVYASHEVSGEQVVATFPTPTFLRRRFALAQDLGLAGVGVWEAGQGLACFPMLW